jgi:SAM-dependent methyltransferase
MQRPAANEFVYYPPIDLGPTHHDQMAWTTGIIAPIQCPCCGEHTAATGFAENLRESGTCLSCGAWTRVRQLSMVTLFALESLTGKAFDSLAEARQLSSLNILNMQASGPIHDKLHGIPGYQCSEYFDPSMASGTMINGVMHQDVMNMSLPSESIDLLITTDVFEHVPMPYKGHEEVLRVLRPGGRHVLTIPFYEGVVSDVVQAEIVNGQIVHHVEHPEYHLDPVHPEGCLVFTAFGLEMLVKLDKLGFDVAVHRLYAPEYGLIGNERIVFEATKRSGPSRTQRYRESWNANRRRPLHQQLPLPPY